MTQRDRDFVRAITRVVEDAIFPFSPGEVMVYTWDNYSMLGGKDLKVAVERIPEYDFIFNVDVVLLMGSERAFLNKLYTELFKHFRYRPSLPVEDHIVLGAE